MHIFASGKNSYYNGVLQKGKKVEKSSELYICKVYYR